MRSCGRARKRDETRRPRGMRGSSGDVASIIDVPSSKDYIGGGGVTVNGGSIWQRKKLVNTICYGVNYGKKRGGYSSMKIRQDEE
jgi:hypothetical protein